MVARRVASVTWPEGFAHDAANHSDSLLNLYLTICTTYTIARMRKLVSTWFSSLLIHWEVLFRVRGSSFWTRFPRSRPEGRAYTLLAGDTKLSGDFQYTFRSPFSGREDWILLGLRWLDEQHAHIDYHQYLQYTLTVPNTWLSQLCLYFSRIRE